MDRMRRSRLQRRGFTLFEVLLALGLTVLLMAAVYSAINVYQHLATAGRDNVERLQIVRALQRRMTVDVRSVLFSEPEEEAEEGDADDAMTTDAAEAEGETTTVAEVTNPEEAIAGFAQGVIGDANSLVLNLSLPPRGAAYSDPFDQDLNRQSSDLVSVTYLLSSPDGGSLQSAVHSRLGKTGLARLAGDRMKIDAEDISGNVDLLAGTAVMLAPEVTSLQFQYFDGVEWIDAWDTSTSQTLPRAIAVKMFIAKLLADGTTQTDADGKGIGKWFRFVIAVPSADPTPPEALEILDGL